MSILFRPVTSYGAGGTRAPQNCQPRSCAPHRALAPFIRWCPQNVAGPILEDAVKVHHCNCMACMRRTHHSRIWYGYGTH